MPKFMTKSIKIRSSTYDASTRTKSCSKQKSGEHFLEIKQKQQSMKDELSQIMDVVSEIQSNMTMLIEEHVLQHEDIASEETINAMENNVLDYCQDEDRTNFQLLYVDGSEPVRERERQEDNDVNRMGENGKKEALIPCIEPQLCNSFRYSTLSNQELNAAHTLLNISSIIKYANEPNLLQKVRRMGTELLRFL